MKKLLLILFLFPITTLANPFVISDTTTQVVTHCGWVLDALAKVDIPVAKDTTGGSYCKYDLAGVSKGTHSIKATFVNIDATWGRSESIFSASLNFTKPDAVISNPPSGLIIN